MTRFVTLIAVLLPFLEIPGFFLVSHWIGIIPMLALVVAGVIVGIMVLLENVMPTYMPDRWVPKSAQDQLHFNLLLFVLLAMGVAGICGAVGGFFGWLLGGGEPKAAWKGAIRAFGAAFLMAAVGCRLRFALLLVPIGTLVASAGAALSVAFLGDAR